MQTPPIVGLLMADLIRVAVPDTSTPGRQFQYPERATEIVSGLLMDSPVSIQVDNPSDDLTRDARRKAIDKIRAQIDELELPKMAHALRDPRAGGRTIGVGIFHGTEEQFRSQVSQIAQVDADGQVTILAEG